MDDTFFQTGGDWDSTLLQIDGTEVAAAQLFIEIRAGRDEFGDPISGGIYDGTSLTALVRPQDEPMSPFDLLPGRIRMLFPGHEIVVENLHPGVEPQATRVAYNGDDVTNRLVDLYVDVNAVDDVVSAYITVYKPHWIRADEVVTYTIVG